MQRATMFEPGSPPPHPPPSRGRALLVHLWTAIYETLPSVSPGTTGRMLLGGCCQRLRCRKRSMGAQKGADMAHRQWNLVWSVLPRIQAHLRIGCQMHGL